MAATTLPPWMFNLDGTFLGFVGDDPAKAKAIYLDVEGEWLTIKLPKEVRTVLRSRLQPGDYLRCIGRTEFDGSTIKLKAHQVFVLLPPRPTPCPHPPHPTTDLSPSVISSSGKNSPSTAPSAGLSASHPSQRPNSHPAAHAIKIQVCRKSGCQRRGGRQLVEALKQALRDRNLHSQVEIQYTGCQSHCSKAPTFTVMPGGHRYSRVKLSRLSGVLDRHFAPAKPVPL